MLTINTPYTRFHTSNIGITYKLTYKLSLYSEIPAVINIRDNESMSVMGDGCDQGKHWILVAVNTPEYMGPLAIHIQ